MFEDKTKSCSYLRKQEIKNSLFSVFNVFNLSFKFNESNRSNQSKRQGGIA